MGKTKGTSIRSKYKSLASKRSAIQTGGIERAGAMNIHKIKMQGLSENIRRAMAGMGVIDDALWGVQDIARREQKTLDVMKSAEKAGWSVAQKEGADGKMRDPNTWDRIWGDVEYDAPFLKETKVSGTETEFDITRPRVEQKDARGIFDMTRALKMNQMMMKQKTGDVGLYRWIEGGIIALAAGF